MLKKNRKGLLLASGLLGALTVSTAAGIVLSACSTTSSTTTRPEETETEYTNKINWDDASSLTGLVKDEQGLYYSDDTKTNVIGFNPSSTVTTITIPATVTTISGYLKVTTTNGTETTTETGAFQGITSLTTITVASNSKLVTIDKLAFSGCTGLVSISDTTGVTKIGSNAFDGCTRLKAFNLSKVQSIGASAFNGCTAFDGAVNLSNVSTIGSNTFKGTSITSVNASNNSWLTSIGANAFNGCTSLTTVTVPAENISKLKTIGGSAFDGCTSLDTFGPTGTAKGSLVTTTSMGIIGAYAFRNTIITTVNASKFTVTQMKYSGDNRTLYGTGSTGSFRDMHYVTAFTLPEGMERIPSDNNGGGYFTGVGDKSTGFDLVLPSSIADFFVYTRSGGAGIVSAPFMNSGVKSIDASKIKSYDIGNVNNMTTGTFYGATNLETVILKPNTTNISSYAFQNCSSLKVVREPNQSYTSGYVATSSITSIGTNAFSNAFAADSGATIDLTATKLTTIPSAFSGSNITSIKLPSTTTSVGANTFFGSKTETLTFGASGISSSSVLFTGSGITANSSKTETPSTYKTANVPFGNNTALTSINYNNFDSSGTTTTTSQQALFETTTSETWTEVAKIINSLSNYTYVNGDAIGEATNLPTNLSAWTAETTPTRTSKIFEDTTITSTTTSGKVSQVVFDKCFSATNTSTGIGNITINPTSESNSFIHNGVTWKYTNDGTSIKLIGSANMYKATVTSGSNSTSYLTFFDNSQVQVSASSGTQTTYNIPSQSKVTVTLTIATKSAA